MDPSHLSVPASRATVNSVNERKHDEPVMDTTLIAADLAKDVIDLACANRTGHIVARRRLNRQQLRQLARCGRTS